MDKRLDDRAEWAIASELAAVLGISRGRVSQLVREQVLQPRRRHGKTQFHIPTSLAAYEATVRSRIDTEHRRAELRAQLAQTLQLGPADDGADDDGPLLPHGVQKVATLAHCAGWWAELLFIAEDDLQQLLSGPDAERAQRVIMAALRAVRSISWVSMAEGLTGGPDLEFHELEHAPIVRQVPQLQALATAMGIDPARPMTDWEYVLHDIELEAAAG